MSRRRFANRQALECAVAPSVRNVAAGRSPARRSSPLLRRQQLVHFGNHLKGIGDVKDIRLSARPAAIRVEADGTAFIDEAPSDGVRFLAVTAGAEAFGVAGG